MNPSFEARGTRNPKKLMAAENRSDGGINPNPCYLQKFRLYETRSHLYMIGKDKNGIVWRVLKVDRLEPSELNIIEDSLYSEIECSDLLRRIHDGNRSTGGLKFVTACYGIIGFVKFLGPYYMLLITKRRKIGAICDHSIYSITKSEIITVLLSSQIWVILRMKKGLLSILLVNVICP
ncbi:hypothetical protein F3Y22_tig00112443pilonHSYRG00195 [Hibiscus syriacus]|uniref:SAC domain-containing protein n=1 Tax=Hibiscus syriacus TaxID=106335 RepID=A0A6A2WZ54_HIBSY|nr:hypothetical protein F3Y22_tig00112443pilonHSYRG00195 [Hibiscus syriacus]